MIEKNLALFDVNGGRFLFGDVLITEYQHEMIQKRYGNCVGFIWKDGFTYVHEVVDYEIVPLPEIYCACGECKAVRIKFTKETAISVEKVGEKS